MLHIDIPTRSDMDSLLAARMPGSVSIYLPTTPVTTDVGASRIELKNLVREALDQLGAAGMQTRSLEQPIQDELDDLIDDDSFWAYQANSLAIFVTQDSIRTYRLPNRIDAVVEVSDRFHLKPLLRALTFPHAAFVLAIAQGSVRLLEISPDLPPEVVKAEGMPTDVASAVGKSSITDRSPSGRVQGAEGQKLRMTQYARQIDRAIRPILAGSDLPLILAATEPLSTIYRAVNSYSRLADVPIPGNPEEMTPVALASAARPVLDELYAAELSTLRERFEVFGSAGRASSDVGDVARAATYGAIDTVLVDLDASVPGRIDEVSGAVTLDHADDARNYGVVDEIARRAYLSGARVLSVRTADVPGGGPVAAILRYAV